MNFGGKACCVEAKTNLDVFSFLAWLLHSCPPISFSLFVGKKLDLPYFAFQLYYSVRILMLRADKFGIYRTQSEYIHVRERDNI